MTVNDVLIFDTETTGIPDRNWAWDLDYEKYPHIVQLAWKFGDVEESHIIRPDGWIIPDDVVEVHGITTDFALEHGESFAAVIDLFLHDCANAGLICGHNIHFDTGMVKANILRELGREFYDAYNVEAALFKGKRIDTMLSTMKWVDARRIDGRLKFPNLGELYSRCFPGETFPAHDAMEDVKAVARCLPVIVDMGLVELKVKEYPDGQLFQKQPITAKVVEELTGAAKIAADAAKTFAASRPEIDQPSGAVAQTDKSGPDSADGGSDDRLPIQPEKSPETAVFAKINGENKGVSKQFQELLEQDNF